MRNKATNKQCLHGAYFSLPPPSSPPLPSLLPSLPPPLPPSLSPPFPPPSLPLPLPISPWAHSGTRFRPLSLEVSQPLFPIAGSPWLQHHIEAIVKVHVHTCVLVHGRKQGKGLAVWKGEHYWIHSYVALFLSFKLLHMYMYMYYHPKTIHVFK